MDYQLFPFFVVALSVPLLLLLGFLARNRRLAGTAALSRLVVADLGWMFFNCLELVDPTEAGTLFWAKLTYLFIVSTPVFWFLFVLDYLGRGPRGKKRIPWGYLAVPALTVLFVFTNEVHGLFWSRIEYAPAGRFLALRVEHGPLFFVGWLYAQGLILAGIGFLVGEGFIRRKAYRGRAFWLLAGVLVVVCFSVLYVGKFLPGLRKDYTPVALALSGIFFGIAAVRHKMFCFVPIGKDRLFEALDDAILVLDEAGLVLEANPAALGLLGTTEDAALGRELASLSPELSAALGPAEEEGTKRLEMRGDGPNPRHLKLKVIPLRGARGLLRGAMVVASDVTAEEAMRTAEREEQAFSRTLSEIAVALSGTQDPDELLPVIIGKVRQAVPCDEASIMLVEEGRVRVRHSAAEGSAELVLPLAETKNLRWMAENRLPLAIPDVSAYEGWVGSAEGRWIRSYVGAPILIGEETIGFISLASARTGFFGEKAAERLRAVSFHAAVAIRNARAFRRMEELATTDGLTGLYVRRHFYDLAARELERASRHGSPVSAIMCDIDRFKRVNDTRGHLAGDEVLRAVARICRANLRAYDLICRYGGEEFAILLPQADLPAAVLFAERLRSRVAEERFPLPSGSLSVTISLGVAQAAAGGAELESLLGAADKALYAAKQGGRNRVAAADHEARE